MLAKSAKDQIFALGAAKSPCRWCGPAMRGGPAALCSAQGISEKGSNPSSDLFCQVANTGLLHRQRLLFRSTATDSHPRRIGYGGFRKPSNPRPSLWQKPSATYFGYERCSAVCTELHIQVFNMIFHIIHRSAQDLADLPIGFSKPQ